MVRQQFLTGTPLFKLLKILIGRRISRKYFSDVKRIVSVSIISTFFSGFDYFLYRRRIENTRIIGSPIFIIGHWRSGTTYLQKLVSQDQQFFTPTFYQCALPQGFLSAEKYIKQAMQKTLPATRIFDSMLFSVDEPFDDEFAMLKLTTTSRMLHFAFPSKASFNEQPKTDTEKWSILFGWFSKKLTYASGKRLLFKSPMNTMRIKEIIQLFPEAKFIYIHRKPEDVFVSSLYQAEKLFEHNKLSETTYDSREYIICRYKNIFSSYKEHKKIIPKSQIIEVAFESLETSPLEVIRKVYAELKINGFEQALPNISRYIESTRGYKKNKFKITKEDRGIVKKEWSAAYDCFGYKN